MKLNGAKIYFEGLLDEKARDVPFAVYRGQSMAQMFSSLYKKLK